MIYVVGLNKHNDGVRVYKFFESETESFFGGKAELLKDLMTKGIMDKRHANLLNDEALPTIWFNPLICKQTGMNSTGSEYILLCKTDKNLFKLVNHIGKVSYTDNKMLNTYTKDNKIANRRIINGEYQSIGTYNITKDMQFEAEIARKYKIYNAKSTLLGRNMSFEYTVEGKQVRLEKYMGSSTDVIVPNFVTTINQGAFLNCRIEAITLDNGLKYIGNSAFQNNWITDIIIPQTVEFIGWGVFYGNNRLISEKHGYNPDTVKMLNKKTIAVDKYYK